MKIVISTGSDFDEQAFRTEVAEVIARVKGVRSDRRRRATNFVVPASLKATIANVVAIPLGAPSTQLP